jgi:P4 family phage/plasmid primase-like protien
MKNTDKTLQPVERPPEYWHGRRAEFLALAPVEKVSIAREHSEDKILQDFLREAIRRENGGTAQGPDCAPRADFEEGLLEPQDCTDVGQAMVLAEEYGEILKFSISTGWIVYDGKVWRESETKAQGLTQELTERQLEEARRMLKKARDDMDKALENEDEEAKRAAHDKEMRAKRYRNFVLGRRKSSNRAATQTEAKPALEIETDRLDANPFLLNTPGGEIDLRTGEMKPHDPAHYHTKITIVAPSDEGAALWRDFLRVITCGDSELEEYLQSIVGLAAVGKVFSEILVIAYGAGRNGKSTFWNLMRRVFGDYAVHISAESLTTSYNKNWEVADFRGARLATFSELEEGKRMDTGKVKRISSTDPIKAERKYKAPFEFTPSHLSVLYTNHLPKVGSTDEGTWRRIKVVLFSAVIEGAADVKNYADVLFEKAGGAALAWVVEGARRAIEARYAIKEPECVRKMIETYREASDWLTNYIQERCETGQGYKEAAGKLYLDYRDYCETTGEYARSDGDFKTALENAGFERRRVTGGPRVVLGLRIVPRF